MIVSVPRLLIRAALAVCAVVVAGGCFVADCRIGARLAASAAGEAEAAQPR